MTEERDPYEEWDAAYVLGALTSAERREFDAHLRTCERCSAAVAELAGMPTLLARVPADHALDLLAEDRPAPEPVPDVLPRLLAAARRSRRRRRIWTSAVGLAAAAVVAIVLTLPGTLPETGSPIAISLQAATANPLTADVAVTAERWGTRIDMTCTYRGDATGSAAPPWEYVLTVTDTKGVHTVVSSWQAGPGDTVHTTGTIDLPVDRIASIEVRLPGEAGAVLLRGRLEKS